jgi:hypothetical protein
MKGFKPVIKMASGGLVPKKMPAGPKLPKPPTALAGPRGPTGPKAANQKGMKPAKPMATMAKGGHVDDKEDRTLIRQMVKPSALKGDKKFGK